MKQFILSAIFLTAIIFLSCNNNSKTASEMGKKKVLSNDAKGQLFIIGGGKRPPSMLQSLIQLSGVDKEGYIVVLPLSSNEPDTVSFYAKRQFIEQGINKVVAFNFEQGKEIAPAKIDSLRNARLIYIAGGDQNKFMAIVKNTPLYTAIHDAYKNGATISGTSAGAAVMSKKMISGNELKHKEYTGEYRTIEAENIEISEGLALIDNAIIDQHFVWRMRMNRLISTAIENPEETSIGIDEATAILVKGNKATVYGSSQVVVLKNPKHSKKIANGLLAAENLNLSIYLPGDSFDIQTTD